MVFRGMVYDIAIPTLTNFAIQPGGPTLYHHRQVTDAVVHAIQTSSLHHGLRNLPPALVLCALRHVPRAKGAGARVDWR